MAQKRAFSVTHADPRAPTQADDLRFYAAAPVVSKKASTSPIGCVVVADTRPRDEASVQKIQKTLETLAHLVMNLLLQEKNILRLYASGDFKIVGVAGSFPLSSASSVHGDAVPSATTTTATTTTTLLTTTAPRLPRCNSFAIGDGNTLTPARLQQHLDQLAIAATRRRRGIDRSASRHPVTTRTNRDGVAVRVA